MIQVFTPFNKELATFKGFNFENMMIIFQELKSELQELICNANNQSYEFE